jgi:hypothetical protein
MIGFEIDIIQFVDASYPGWVKGSFTDAHGKEWTIIEKGPVVSNECLDANSQYPQKGFVAGTVISERFDADNRKIVLFNTETPWGINAESGETQFELYADQLRELQH